MTVITTWNEVPSFADEAEEAAFWQTHELDAYLIKGSVFPESKESTTVSLRFDPRMLSRIKRVARGRYINYQSMIKQWLAERLEDEMK